MLSDLERGPSMPPLSEMPRSLSSGGQRPPLPSELVPPEVHGVRRRLAFGLWPKADEEALPLRRP